MNIYKEDGTLDFEATMESEKSVIDKVLFWIRGSKILIIISTLLAIFTGIIWKVHEINRNKETLRKIESFENVNLHKWRDAKLVSDDCELINTIQQYSLISNDEVKLMQHFANAVEMRRIVFARYLYSIKNLPMNDSRECVNLCRNLKGDGVKHFMVMAGLVPSNYTIIFENAVGDTLRSNPEGVISIMLKLDAVLSKTSPNSYRFCRRSGLDDLQAKIEDFNYKKKSRVLDFEAHSNIEFKKKIFDVLLTDEYFELIDELYHLEKQYLLACKYRLQEIQ